MSLAVLGRACYSRVLAPTTSLHALRVASVPTFAASRSFSSTPATLLRKEPKARPPLSKKALQAKARKRASKARKNIYENEKMPLSEAVSVLRVRSPFLA